MSTESKQAEERRFQDEGIYQLCGAVSALIVVSALVFYLLYWIQPIEPLVLPTKPDTGSGNATAIIDGIHVDIAPIVNIVSAAKSPDCCIQQTAQTPSAGAPRPEQVIAGGIQQTAQTPSAGASFCPAKNCRPKPIGAVRFRCGSANLNDTADRCRLENLREASESIVPPADDNGSGSGEHFVSVADLATELTEQRKQLGRCGTVLVEGHADASGTVVYNLGLSERRAEFVVRKLRKALPGEEWIFRVIAKGESHNEPNDQWDKPENRKATVALCVPVPETESNDITDASK